MRFGLCARGDASAGLLIPGRAKRPEQKDQDADHEVDHDESQEDPAHRCAGGALCEDVLKADARQRRDQRRKHKERHGPNPGLIGEGCPARAAAKGQGGVGEKLAEADRALAVGAGRAQIHRCDASEKY
jgi:hypothetical protein